MRVFEAFGFAEGEVEAHANELAQDAAHKKFRAARSTRMRVKNHRRRRSRKDPPEGAVAKTELPVSVGRRAHDAEYLWIVPNLTVV